MDQKFNNLPPARPPGGPPPPPPYGQPDRKKTVFFMTALSKVLNTHYSGAFLIPYIMMLLLGALPLFYMELILGKIAIVQNKAD